MRYFIIIVTLWNILPVMCLIELINENLGDLQFHAQVGNLPLKYYPLTERDLTASNKAADVIDFIYLVPHIDPMKIQLLGPLGIDIPILWLTGKVYIKNFVMSGVKQLIVNSVEIRLENLRADLNVTVPLVYFEGDFVFQATISFLPLTFSCHISANLMDVNVLASAGSKLAKYVSTGDILQIDSATVDIDIRNVQFNMTDLEIGGEQEEVGLAISQLFTGFSDGNVFDNLLTEALDIANNELLGVPVELFRDYLIDEI